MKRLLLLAVVLTTAWPAFAQQSTEKDPTARFWESRRVMLKGDAASAAELFRTLVAADPKGEKADDSLYWMGRCYLRIADHEPDAVVAFKRLIRDYPVSPFVDDAARELGRLKDLSIVPELVKRLDAGGTAAEFAARALAELGDERGIEFLTKKFGKTVGPRPRGDLPPPADQGDEIRLLKEEIRRLKKELDESLKVLAKLLKEKAGSKGAEK